MVRFSVMEILLLLILIVLWFIWKETYKRNH